MATGTIITSFSSFGTSFTRLFIVISTVAISFGTTLGVIEPYRELLPVPEAYFKTEPLRFPTPPVVTEVQAPRVLQSQRVMNRLQIHGRLPLHG